MHHLVPLGVEIEEAADALHGPHPLVPHHFQNTLALAALTLGRSGPGSLGIAQRMDEPTDLRRRVAVIGPTALDDGLERLVIGQTAVLMSHRPAQNALHHVQVVGHGQQVAGKAIEGPPGRRLLGSGGLGGGL